MAKMRDYVYGSPKFEREINKAVSGGGTPEGTDIKSTGETSGKVLTADGSGGASWETASGGDGDVTASGTLTSNNIILGNGTKSIKAMATGTWGQFLYRGQNAPEWKGLYNHCVALGYSGDELIGEITAIFNVIDTTSTAYTSMDDILDGKYVASGDVDDLYDSQAHCRVLYVNTNNNEIGYWVDANTGISTIIPISVESITVTDVVTQIL